MAARQTAAIAPETPYRRSRAARTDDPGPPTRRVRAARYSRIFLTTACPTSPAFFTHSSVSVAPTFSS